MLYAYLSTFSPRDAKRPQPGRMQGKRPIRRILPIFGGEGGGENGTGQWPEKRAFFSISCGAARESDLNADISRSYTLLKYKYIEEKANCIQSKLYTKNNVKNNGKARHTVVLRELSPIVACDCCWRVKLRIGPRETAWNWKADNPETLQVS